MDWDLDGKLDILSGCYWTEDANAGHIYFIKGTGDAQFATPAPLLNAEGKALENITLSDEEYSTPEGQNRVTEAICTHQFAVDFDGDGDLDVVNGCFGSSFYYFENTGTAEQPKLSSQPVKLPVNFKGYHAAPHLVDWDQDGDLDLLTGSAQGGVQISFNTGSRTEPVWSEFQQLIAEPAEAHREQVLFDGVALEPGSGTRVWAHDWNGDGWLDLIVGDSTTVVRPATGLSQAEFQAKQAAHEEEVAKLMEAQREVYERYSEALEKSQNGEEIDPKITEEVQNASKAFGELQKKQDEWCETRMTGHVWVYVRKAPASPVSQ